MNAGISGNRLLSGSPCYGDALVSRFEHDALRQPGVRSVILLVGINDINFPSMAPRAGLDCDDPHTPVTADLLLRGYRRLIAQAHQRGVRIYGATLTPASLPPEREAIRTAVNDAIRSSHAFDGVIDFDQPCATQRTRTGSSAVMTAAIISIRAMRVIQRWPTRFP